MAKKSRQSAVPKVQEVDRDPTIGWESRISADSPPIVRVLWVDACIQVGGTFETPPGWEESYNSGTFMETTGFLLKQDPKWITVAMERNATSGNAHYREKQDIPMYSVCRLDYLHEGTGCNRIPLKTQKAI